MRLASPPPLSSPAMLPFPHVLLTAVGIITLALLIAAALFLMYEIGRLVGEKTTADKFPEAKKAAVRRSRSVLGGMFAEQLAPYLPNFPFSPTEAKFIGAPIDFLVFKGMDDQHIEEVIFVEVKSGAARLNHNEHSLKDAIINKRVRWHEYRVPLRRHPLRNRTRTRDLARLHAAVSNVAAAVTLFTFQLLQDRLRLACHKSVTQIIDRSSFI